MDRKRRPDDEHAATRRAGRPDRVADGATRGGASLADLIAGGGIADIQRQAGNAAATSLLAARGGTQRAGAPEVQRKRGRGGRRAAAPATMSRTEFEAEAGRYGVGRTQTGTLDQQVARLNAMSGADHLGDVLQADVAAGRQQWVSWDPGASSPVYRSIINGLADFSTTMGGLPPIRELLFFKREYRGVRIGGTLRTSWDPTGADYSAGVMNVYENAVLQATAKVLPTARDATGAPARADQPTQAQGIGRVITHELGHGLQEVAHNPAAIGRAAGPLLMTRYATAIGWRRASTGDRAWRLYDIGDPAVKAALDAGGVPDQRHLITADTWNQGWHEQPISRYQVQTGPFEDFPEAVMAFIANRAVLQQRSPARHDFVQGVITELAGRLGTPTGASGGGAGTSGGGLVESSGGGSETQRP